MIRRPGVFVTVLGLLCYGTYEMTNYATLADWSWEQVIVDSAWGMLLTGFAAWAGRAEVRLQDCRNVSGRFDNIDSIEMIEAVGERHWPAYFATSRRG